MHAIIRVIYRAFDLKVIRDQEFEIECLTKIQIIICCVVHIKLKTSVKVNVIILIIHQQVELAVMRLF